eukprot:TRINITY_DN109966_c0_g1_i1.p1 TRINITY_DN109966_c0_g1~~TRINITY_DN109966_c0_g1_i1.p1  ORF type:complete len:307 (-),score=73.77 TRINITY_DN109966_c0_g1_i1:8-928(-)
MPLASILREALEGLLAPGTCTGSSGVRAALQAPPESAGGLVSGTALCTLPWHKAVPRTRHADFALPLRTAFEAGGEDKHKGELEADPDPTKPTKEKTADSKDDATSKAKRDEKKEEDEIEHESPPPPMWENLEGLPKVTLKEAGHAYFSKDIAESDLGEMNPTFGCKCSDSDWRPAMSHPSINFKQEFLDDHPDFLGRVSKLQVNLVNDKTKKAQWNATYDLRRFLKPGDQPALTETMPALPNSGTQLRFLTFCPGESTTYTMNVTALDAKDEQIDYLVNDASSYEATPAPPAEEESGSTPKTTEA